MRALTRTYHLAVLWLLSLAAPDVVETIYRHGHEDGANELREFMRRELEAVQAARALDRARSYSQGFNDAMRATTDDVPDEDAPIERVM